MRHPPPPQESNWAVPTRLEGVLFDKKAQFDVTGSKTLMLVHTNRHNRFSLKRLVRRKQFPRNDKQTMVSTRRVMVK